MAKYDLLIKGGMVFDGRRNPRFKSDIGIKNGCIGQIGLIDEAEAERTLDAHGLHVAPGFVDLHTHYDSQLFWDSYCSSSGWHGVTTAVIGNCGFGFAPCRPEDRERTMLAMTRNETIPLECMRDGMPWDWVSFPEFIQSVRRARKSINIAINVPLNPLMMWTMGLERAKAGVVPTPEEHAEMARLLDEALLAGGIGLSAQRMGAGSFQRDFDGTPMATDLMHDETMLYLADVLRKRNLGSIQYAYIDFAAFTETYSARPEAHLAALGRIRPHVEDVARRSGRPVIVGSVGLGEADLGWVKTCRERGLRIYAQGTTVNIRNRSLPLNVAAGANVFDFSTLWCDTTVGSVEEVKSKLADPEIREKLRLDLKKYQPDLSAFEEWTLCGGKSDETSVFDGARLCDIATARGDVNCFDTFCDITIKDNLGTDWMVPSKRNTDLSKYKEMADDPYCIPGVSDGGAHTKFLTTGHYGTLFLTTFVREHNWVSLEDAHYRLSALPAHCVGLEPAIGSLVVGAPADIIVYDYQKLDISKRETVQDLPSGEWRVVDWGIGYRWVIVNGRVTIENDVETDVNSGRVISGARNHVN
jgi:N-acyl-D-amino-acid deacylase